MGRKVVERKGIIIGNWLALEKGGENGAEKGKVKDGAMRDLYVGESGTRKDDKSSELATFFPSVAMRYAPGLHSLPPRRVRVVRATGAADPRQRAVSRKLQSRYYKSLMEARSRDFSYTVEGMNHHHLRVVGGIRRRGIDLWPRDIVSQRVKFIQVIMEIEVKIFSRAEFHK